MRALERCYIRGAIGIHNFVLALLARTGCTRSAQEPRTVLIYRTARLGDFLTAVPAFHSLRKQMPHAHLGLLTTSSTLASMQTVTAAYATDATTLPWLPFAVPSVLDEAKVFSMRNFRSALRECREFVNRLKPDIAFLLPFSGEGFVGKAKKLLFLRMSGVRCPIFGWRVYSSWGLPRRAQYDAGAFDHQVVAPLRGLREYFGSTEEICTSIYVDDAADRWAGELWERFRLKARHVVAVFPGGSFPHKRWPIERFVRVCAEIGRNPEITYLVVGPGSDRSLAAELCAAMPERTIDLTGLTSLPQLGAVLKRCRMFLGNDSGPAHLASAVGCPGVTVMSGVEFPGMWEPWHSRGSAVRHRVACEGCLAATECPLGSRECILGIAVSQVVAGCERVLQSDRVAR